MTVRFPYTILPFAETFLCVRHWRSAGSLLAWLLSLGLIAAVAGSSVGAEELTPEQTQFFESKIRPILVKECYGCHSNQAGNARGGLRLDSKQLMEIGGASGAAIVPGNLEESLLYNAITHQDFVMPPQRKLSAETIADFRKWIEMGAPDPRDTAVATLQSTITEQDIAAARENYWAYQQPVTPELPPMDGAGWSRTEIDRFVAAQRSGRGMEPAVDAEPYQVLRRLCFDLTGLPPTKIQIQWFERRWAEDPDAAVESVVDGLLNRPQFGERWGRHWLDVVRYAESTGREVNMTFPHAWRYRDYVIDAFNQDKPFNDFVREQIAGDLLPVADDAQWAQNLVATTFLAIGPKNVNEQNRVQFAADLIDEQIDATTRVFLGSSVACARCHDHKFDAFAQADYYALAGIFRNATTYFGNPPSDVGGVQMAQLRQTSSLLRLPVDDPNPYDKSYSAAELERLRTEIEDKREELLAARRGGAGGNASQAILSTLRLQNQIAELSAKLAVVDADGQPLSYCMGVQESTTPQNARVLVRGEIDQPGPVVERGIPRVFAADGLTISEQSGGRLELADWLASPQNPLTARVMVNRVWQHLIGRGIVASTENFGVTGSAPSHPELLDYLAVQFIESGWSVKSLVREIANSRVYRMASDFNPEFHRQDPENAFLWRAHPRRLDAESMRDSMLAISGTIDLERPRGSEVAEAGYGRVRGGVLGDPRERIRSEMAAMQAERQRPTAAELRGMSRSERNRVFASRSSYAEAMRTMSQRIANALDMEDATFRSVYLPVVRDEIPRSLEVFDFADANSVVGTRETSNTANQSLYMMNNRFVIDQSEAFARRLSRDSRDRAKQVEAAFLLAYGRVPNQDEREASMDYLRDAVAAGRTPLGLFCQCLFASAEFRALD